jgi:hypothetical protein
MPSPHAEYYPHFHLTHGEINISYDHSRVSHPKKFAPLFTSRSHVPSYTYPASKQHHLHYDSLGGGEGGGGRGNDLENHRGRGQ